MPPNSEDTRRMDSFKWFDDMITKEKQRPPIYNPEDYALSLKKWGRRPPANGPGLYSKMSVDEVDTATKGQGATGIRDYRNPMLTSNGGCEMTLRQFGTVTELLSKLRNDLRMAYPSFVQEFISDPLDGITLLLDLLRAIQLSQSNAGNVPSSQKISLTIQRRSLLDELACLQCLLSCCLRYSESVRKLTSSSAGLFTLSVCIMSNVNKSRIIALQLLTKACESTSNGNSTVSEALSTLRLRFGEPVRFRFLVGMLTSAGGQSELIVSGMKFINTFMESAGSVQKKLYVQAELEQAGFDLVNIKKNITLNSPSADATITELDRWEKNFIDAESLKIRLDDTERENDSLRDKVLLLERRIQILQEEKGILMSLEKCLKERCSELQDEVISLKSQNINSNSSPDDEGISSSQRSSSSDNLQEEPTIYEMYTVQNEDSSTKLQFKTNSLLNEDDEDETTIDEVIEELRNIINDAETEDFEKAKIEEAQVQSKIQMRVEEEMFVVGDDGDEEIVPSNLHPQPPQKTRSLVHLYIPTDDYYNKEIFFEHEYTTSDESSDSLLSATKYESKQAESRPTDIKTKSKSLDRIDDGLDAMVDIVTVNDQKPESSKGKYVNPKMFLPLQKHEENRYYFPRVQEKRASATSSNSFLVKRGHGNAGMYSGKNYDQPKNDYFTTTGSRNSSSKLTDFPSGLY